MSEFLNLSNYPRDWATQYGSEFLTLGSGVSPSNVSFSSSGNSLYMKVDDFNHPDNHFFIRTTKLKFNKEESHIPLSSPNSIVIAKRGAAIAKNRVRIAETPIAVDTNLMTIAIAPSHDLTYFKYLLELINLTSIADTTSIPQLNNFHLNEAIFSFPLLEQQRTISSILTSVDEVIEKTQAHISKLRDLKKGMMQELLTRGIGHTEFKDSPVGRIPKAWEVRPCDDICQQIVVGIVIKPAQYYQPTGIPAFRSANVREDGLNKNDLKFISEESNELLKKSKVKIGDVLTVRTGYPGTSAVVTEEYVGCNCIDLIISRPKKKMDSDFFCYWVNSDHGKGQVLQSQGGLAQQHFNVGDMKKLLVPIPPEEEQVSIASTLHSVSDAIKLKEKRLERFQNTKKALMQDLLTGEVRVKVN